MKINIRNFILKKIVALLMAVIMTIGLVGPANADSNFITYTLIETENNQLPNMGKKDGNMGFFMKQLQGLAEPEAEHKHNECAYSECAEHMTTEILWTAIKTEEELVEALQSEEDGYYYLTEDINYLNIYEDYIIDIVSHIGLCLNGNTIDLQKLTINVSTEGSLSICDCGILTDAYHIRAQNEEMQAAIVNKGTVKLYGVSISSLRYYNIYNEGTLFLKDAKLGHPDLCDYTVYHNGEELILTGNLEIYSQFADIYLGKDQYIVISEAVKDLSVDAPLTIGAEEADDFIIDEAGNVTAQSIKVVEIESNISFTQEDMHRLFSSYAADFGLVLQEDGTEKTIWIENKYSKFDENGFSIPDGTVYQRAKRTTDQYDVDGDGITDIVYEISNAGQLYWFAAQVNQGDTNANAIVVNDIVVNSNVLDDKGDVVPNTGLRSWIPIEEYNGVFNGQSSMYRISGLYFNDPAQAEIGLFRQINSNGVVKDVSIEDSYFCGAHTMGAIAAKNGGKIINCSSNATIIGLGCDIFGWYVCDASYLGGICGFNDGIIDKCVNNGKVSGEYNIVGGICGASGYSGNNSQILNSVNNGAVYGAALIGGISGLNYSEMHMNSNTGTISSGGDDEILANLIPEAAGMYLSAAGGIAGWNIGGIIDGASNSGSVTGVLAVGGICGAIDVISTVNVSEVGNCFNTGTINGNMAAGGIAGCSTAEVSNSYNVFADNNGDASQIVGGIPGMLDSPQNVNCFYLAEEADPADEGAKTLEEFESGEVAWLLSGSSNEVNNNTIWGQNVGTDGFPMFNHARVYYGYDLGEVDEKQKHFSNERKYDEQGILDIANAVVAIEDEESIVYDGTKHTPNITVKYDMAVLEFGKDYTVEYGENTEIGEGIIIVTGTVNSEESVKYGGSKTVTFEIRKPEAKIEKLPESMSDLIYTGKEQILISEGVATGGTMQYAVEQNGEYSTQIPTAVNAGTYKVWYKVVGDAQHRDLVPKQNYVEVMIKPISIQNAKIQMGDPLTYTGQTQVQPFVLLLPEELQNMVVTYNSTGMAASDVGVYEIVVKGEGNFNGSVAAQYMILPDASGIEGLAVDNVTSEYEVEIKAVKSMMANANTDLADEELKSKWKNIFDMCEILLVQIEDAKTAMNTVNIEKVKDVTFENVTREDYDALSKAKSDLENALGEFLGNYTQAEKEKIQTDITRISKAMQTIEGEKDSIPDYVILEGDNSYWIRGYDDTFVMKASGSFDDFIGIEVDGVEVEKQNYTVKEGSTVVILHSSYLESLSVGRHTVTILYSDGEVSGSFEIKGITISDSSTSDLDHGVSTGDIQTPSMWLMLMWISMVILIGTVFVKRKLR